MKFLSRLIIFLLLLVVTACGEDETNNPQLPDVGLPDSQLAGNWSGTISGDFGSAPLSCSLSEDGSLDCTIPTGSPYCKIVGTWGVINMRWNARGEDDCVETTVSFSASADLTTLAGNWLDSDGLDGTFGNEQIIKAYIENVRSHNQSALLFIDIL